MKLEAKAMVFEVNPLLDPARGGCWGCVQLWRDLGTAHVTQLVELKWRFDDTVAGADRERELVAMTETVVRYFSQSDVTDVATINSVVM